MSEKNTRGTALRYFPLRRLDRPEILFWGLGLSLGVHLLVLAFVDPVQVAQKNPRSAPVINVEMALLEAIDEVVADPWVFSGDSQTEVGSVQQWEAPERDPSSDAMPDGSATPSDGALIEAGQPAQQQRDRHSSEYLAEHGLSPGLRPRRIRRLHANSDLKTLEALYLNRWQRKVESVAVLYFAPELMRLEGRVPVRVRVEASGKVRSVQVLDADVPRHLADMVLKIMREAAPFPPFPDELAVTTDVLEVTRDWFFHGGTGRPDRPAGPFDLSAPNGN